MKRQVFLIYLFALLAVVGCCLACQASDPMSRARAALALAAASKVQDCGCTSPANCNCPGGCTCAGCTLHAHPQTARAEDGGPDWTWDEKRGDWFRVVPVSASPTQQAATSIPQPVLSVPPAPVFFPPQPQVLRFFGGGGGRRGGC